MSTQMPSETIGKPYWHIHHGRLIEFATEPIENRIEYIRESKPKSEIALRLKLLKPVQGKLPDDVHKAWTVLDKARADVNKATADVDKAWTVLDKARVAYDKAREAYYKAGADVDKVIADNLPAIMALHEKECPNCPWDGKTIFPEEHTNAK